MPNWPINFKRLATTSEERQAAGDHHQSELAGGRGRKQSNLGSQSKSEERASF